MLGRIKLSTLVCIAGGGGMAVGAMAVLLKKETDRQVNRAAFIKTALDMVEKEPDVLELIGQPYTLGKPEVMDVFSRSVNHFKVRVPLKGTNDSAFIYAFARKKNPKDRVKLFKIEMTFNKIKGKKIVLFDVENTDAEQDVELKDIKPVTKEKVKKTSPIPEGMIPERDPNRPRKVPRSILMHRKAKKGDTEASTNDGTEKSNSDEISPSN